MIKPWCKHLKMNPPDKSCTYWYPSCNKTLECCIDNCGLYEPKTPELFLTKETTEDITDSIIKALDRRVNNIEKYIKILKANQDQFQDLIYKIKQLLLL